MNRLLWVIQGMLAALFLFNGVTKLTLPAAVLALQFPLSVEFVRFIGVCELLGALGLTLPGLLRIRPELTTLAATGLVIIMVGATATTLIIGGGILALMPFVVGLLAAVVAYGRWRLAPLAGSTSPTEQQLAS